MINPYNSTLAKAEGYGRSILGGNKDDRNLTGRIVFFRFDICRNSIDRVQAGYFDSLPISDFVITDKTAFSAHKWQDFHGSSLRFTLAAFWRTAQPVKHGTFRSCELDQRTQQLKVATRNCIYHLIDLFHSDAGFERVIILSGCRLRFWSR